MGGTQRDSRKRLGGDGHGHYLIFWLCWVSTAASGLFLVMASRGCCVFAVRELLILVASLVDVHRF